VTIRPSRTRCGKMVSTAVLAWVLSSTACGARVTPTRGASADNRCVPGAPGFLAPRSVFPSRAIAVAGVSSPGDRLPHDLVGPRAQVRRERVPVHRPKDGMERGGTGGSVGEAEGLRDPCAIMASPCGHSALAARATPHRTARQCDDGGSRRALTTRLAHVRKHRQHCNERTWMCYHQVPPLVRVGAHVGDARQAKSHLEHHPLSLLRTCHAIPLRKLNDPGHIPVRGHENSAHHREVRACVYTSSARMLNFQAPNGHHVATSPQKTPVLADQCVYAHPRAALPNSREVHSFSQSVALMHALLRT
jgi:hypothetical protein